MSPIRSDRWPLNPDPPVNDAIGGLNTYPALVAVSCAMGIRVVSSPDVSFPVTFIVRKSSLSPISFSNAANARCTISSSGNYCASTTAETIPANTLVDIILTTAGHFSSGQTFAIALTCQ
jgi:hypothetical protein